jgi:solute carrier family 25 (mitochondrial S-adenosylmethionine transporter), member 26
VGSAPGAALFFVTYDSSKGLLREARRADEQLAGGSGRGILGAWSETLEHMLAATLGEIAACSVRVPTEVVKQRAQASQYPSSLAALKYILGQRAVMGFGGVWREIYRGWSVTVMREVPFTMIQFPLWEAMKTYRRRTTGCSVVSATESGFFGSIAGAVAAGITTPLDVLKTRMMLAREKQRMLSVLSQILRDSGPRAFFAGIGPRVFWISAGGAIFLGSYQWAYNILEGVR